VDEATMRSRLSEARAGHLATVRPDGLPHVVVCCFAVDRETAYSAVDAKPKTTLALARLSNVRANPWATLLVDHYEEDWSTLWWVRVDGRARVVEEEAERTAALELLVAKYEQYRERTPPGPVLAVEIATWRAWP
jgi:PPOX class probable F420-dependent enzyme